MGWTGLLSHLHAGPCRLRHHEAAACKMEDDCALMREMLFGGTYMYIHQQWYFSGTTGI